MPEIRSLRIDCNSAFNGAIDRPTAKLFPYSRETPTVITTALLIKARVTGQAIINARIR